VIGGLELPRLISSSVRISVAAAALAGVAYGVWFVLDEAFGEGLAGQIVSMGAGLIAGAAVYAAVLMVLRVPEAEQIRRLVRDRRG
jgi:hypothetical protein